MSDWKVVFLENRGEAFGVWREPFVELRVPLLFNLRRDPFEKAQHNSNTYNDWFLDRPFVIVPLQKLAGKFLMTMKDYPPSQTAGSFNLEKIQKQIEGRRGQQVAPTLNRWAAPSQAARPAVFDSFTTGTDAIDHHRYSTDEARTEVSTAAASRKATTSCTRVALPSRVPGRLSGSRRDALLPGALSAAAAGKKTFTILHTNDMHSSLHRHGPGCGLHAVHAQRRHDPRRVRASGRA